MIFQKISNFIKSNKKIFYYFGFFVVVYMMSSDFTFADEKEDVQKVIGWINVIFVIASVFIGLLTQLVTLFLNAGWINGTIIGLGEHLKTMWIMVSNLVYFIFAFILIWIAFMNIIGKGEKWELKQALPKFIIGVLIVPFSWFFIQFVLSISAVLTVQVISLPFNTFNTVFTQDILSQELIPTDCTIDLKNASIDDTKVNSNSTATSVSESISKVYNCTGKKSIGDLLKDSNSMFGIISIYTYGIFGIDNINIIAKDDVNSWVTLLQHLAIKGIIDIILIITLLILLVSLGLALFTRGVWLWIYAMFSPVFGLLYFFDKKEGGGEGASKNFNVKEFINLALVPVYVAAALSFGLLFIYVAGQGLNKGNDTSGNYISANGDSITLGGGLNYTIKGTIGNSGKSGENNNLRVAIGILQGSVGTLVISLFGIVILWMSVMAALKSSSITGTVVEPIAAFGKSIGDLAMKSPQYAPVFGGFSAKSLQKAGNMPMSALETKTSNKVSPFQKHVNKAFGVETVDINKQARLKALYVNGIEGKELGEAQKLLKEIGASVGTNNPTFQGLMKEFGSNLKTSPHTQSMQVTEGMLENLFDSSGKISKEGYGMLDNNKNTPVASVTAGRADARAAAHINANSEYKESQEGEIGVTDAQVDKLKTSTIVGGDIKMNIDTSGELVVGNPTDGNIGSMTFEKYSNIISQTDPKKILSGMGIGNDEQFKKMVTNLGLSKDEVKKVLELMFANIKRTNNADGTNDIDYLMDELLKK